MSGWAGEFGRAGQSIDYYLPLCTRSYAHYFRCQFSWKALQAYLQLRKQRFKQLNILPKKIDLIFGHISSLGILQLESFGSLKQVYISLLQIVAWLETVQQGRIKLVLMWKEHRHEDLLRVQSQPPWWEQEGPQGESLAQGIYSLESQLITTSDKQATLVDKGWIWCWRTSMEGLGLSFLSGGGLETEARAYVDTHHRENLIKGGIHGSMRGPVLAPQILDL